MNKKEYKQFSEELLLLEKLKSEQAKNLKRCMNRIDRRRRIILFSTSIAAALVAVSFLLWNPTQNIHHQISESKKINTPTLILESGETISLNNTQSELKSLKEEAIKATEATHQPVEKFNTVIIPNCYTHKVILEDGTEVCLNANSEMKYPTSFNNKTREVYLKGEAYFKVAKSSTQFIVHAENLSIKVYGTEFNVNTNRNDNIETVLVEGVVGVSSDKNKEEISLKVNQLFSYNPIDGTGSLGEVNPSDYLGWMSGNFICNSRPLSQLLEDVSAWYGVKFMSDSAISTKIVNVNISRAITLKELLETIQEMSNVTFIHERRNEYSIK